MIDEEVLSSAYLKFQDSQKAEELWKEKPELVSKTEMGTHYLKVPGIAINDHFQVLNNYNEINNRIFMIAVPYMGGFNPDYSGLDFCETASQKISSCLFNLLEQEELIL